VLLLAQQFLDEHAARAGRPAPGLHPDTAAALLGWPWPGNVRELRNAMEHAFVLCAGPEILPRHLPDRLQSARPSAAPAPALDAGPAELLPLDVVEKRHILSVLAACGGNKAQAARVLAIGRKTLYRKLELWGELGADEAEPD
jgi:DNA-binding NtrC family response regulator